MPTLGRVRRKSPRHVVFQPWELLRPFFDAPAPEHGAQSTRNVPSFRRAAAVEEAGALSEELLEGAPSSVVSRPFSSPLSHSTAQMTELAQHIRLPLDCADTPRAGTGGGGDEDGWLAPAGAGPASGSGGAGAAKMDEDVPSMDDAGRGAAGRGARARGCALPFSVMFGPPSRIAQAAVTLPPP